MGNHHNGAFKVLQRHGQGLAHFQIQVVGRLVKQEEVRFLPGNHGKRHPGLFTARERADGTQGLIAMEIETAEKVPDTLL